MVVLIVCVQYLVLGGVGLGQALLATTWAGFDIERTASGTPRPPQIT